MRDAASLTLLDAAGKPRMRRQAFVGATSAFRAARIETPELDARLLLCHAAGLTQEAFVAAPEIPSRERERRRPFLNACFWFKVSLYLLTG